MTRQLTKPEVLRRIAMCALLDAVPGMTHARLVVLCHASYTTVHDAASHDIPHWLSILETAPDPRVASASQPRVAPPSARVPITQQQAYSRPGDRRHARLVTPDMADQALPLEENPKADIEPSDAGWRDDRNIVVVDPRDNPIPRDRKKPRNNNQ